MSRISRSDDRPLYGLLGVSRTATDAEIARGYRRLALQFHPDRNPDGAEKFKELSSAYAILSDKEKRSLYDLTGVVPGSAEDPNGPEGGDAESMADRSNTIKEQLEAFFKTYAGSDEERADFVKGFDKTGGNFRKMVREHLIFDNGVESEVARLHRLGTALIREGRLRATEAWSASTTPQGIRKAEKDMRREREEADDVLREMGLDEESQRRAREARENSDIGALQALIQNRQRQSWETMMSGLEARYIDPEKERRRAEKFGRASSAAGEVKKRGRKEKKTERTKSKV